MKKKLVILSALLLSLVFGGVLFQKTAFATTFYASSTKDTFVPYWDVNTNYGDATYASVLWYSGGRANALDSFNISSIPAGVSVTSSTLVLWTHNGTGGGGTNFQVCALTRNFTEMGATWNKYDGVNNWTTAGGDYNASYCSTYSAPFNQTYALINVSSTVQYFINNSLPYVNFINRKNVQQDGVYYSQGTKESTAHDFDTLAPEANHYGYPRLYVEYNLPTPSVSFAYPPNGTTTPSFNAFLMDFNYLTEAQDYSTLKINYGKNLSACIAYNDGSGCYSTEQPQAGISKTNAFMPQMSLLSAGSYQATAFLYNGYTLVATSSEVFTISGAPPISYLDYYPTSTWATSTLPVQITCDPNDSFFQYSLCKLGQFLFIPSQDSLNQFSVLKEQIVNKVPFGYLPLIQTAFNTLSTTTAVFTLATSSAVVSKVFTPLRSGLIIALWLIFAVWLFHRIKNFEL